jgi:hypothetical protein
MMQINYKGHNLIPNVETKINNIKKLVNTMKVMPQLDAPVKHHFSKGVYAREIFMCKDMLIVGKIHKTRHLNIISQGKCTVVTPTRRLEIEAPYTFESFEGEQKVVYMHEDVIWTTIHLTEETNLAKIEEQCIAEDYDEQLIDTLIESFGGTRCLGEW